ncbi:MAG: AraC-family transcriptional regulator [Sphingomonas bacterium]|uniref:AraC family transcriptional regulator n=1 Tax=Sphingomonas bacterium TaxID=1895847 RepID=UPI002623A0F1|nr:AraC family transcriptional regulator [Sphingomonas bacterium]MDB5703321.1 AraC-family transcriptional regulator [Sphingomonas bacterium]
MPKPTVAAGVTSKMLELAVDLGADRGALLDSSGVDPAALQDFDARIPLADHIALLRAAKEQCRNPAFALHYGNSVNLAEVSVVGLIGYASATMLDAFVELSRYSRLILDLDLGPGARFTLEREADGPWIVDHRPHPNDCPELTEIAFSQMVNGTRRFGETPFVREVELTHPDPGYRAEYERILGATVTFDSSRNAMRIDPAWLSHPIALQPRYVFGILTRHADAMLHLLDTQLTMRGRVEQLILPILHTGQVGMSSIAARLGCSRDTLYRRLKAEGVTFAKVVDDLRHRLALDYLAGGKVSVNETAYLVGFSDPAAFSRAFIRWSGQRPGRMSRIAKS